ncbi:MAG: hypothetical protein FWE35_00900 [Streptosporangiales bacterium]|nr:hypothetical protein [Streptosporangiales bacterium]
MSHADRTPDIPADPELGTYLRELARLLDARQAELGRAAIDRPPPWSERLGPVPADEAGRENWALRAGAVAAYREEFGYCDATPIGREPESPEARASWQAAARALGTDPAQLDLARRSDGDLHAVRARYRRELAWAPANVDDDLRSTILARRDYQTEATIAQAAARVGGDPPAQKAAADRARKYQRAADTLARREEKLTAASEERARWHEQTSGIREDALAASAELRRRGVDVAPLEEPRRQDAPAEDAGRPDGGPDWDRLAAQLKRARTAAELAAQDRAAKSRAPASGQQRRRPRPHEQRPPLLGRPPQGPHRDGPGMSR